MSSKGAGDIVLEVVICGWGGMSSGRGDAVLEVKGEEYRVLESSDGVGEGVRKEGVPKEGEGGRKEGEGVLSRGNDACINGWCLFSSLSSLDFRL